MSSRNKKLKRKNAPRNWSNVGWGHGIKMKNNPGKNKCRFCEKIITRGIYHFNHQLSCAKNDESWRKSFVVRKLTLNTLIKSCNIYNICEEVIEESQKITMNRKRTLESSVKMIKSNISRLMANVQISQIHYKHVQEEFNRWSSLTNYKIVFHNNHTFQLCKRSRMCEDAWVDW